MDPAQEWMRGGWGFLAPDENGDYPSNGLIKARVEELLPFRFLFDEVSYIKPIARLMLNKYNRVTTNGTHIRALVP